MLHQGTKSAWTKGDAIGVVANHPVNPEVAAFRRSKEIFGYKTQTFRKALCIAGHILSCGALLLVFYWKPAWDVWANCVPCDLQEADIILLRTTDEFNIFSWKKVIWISLSALDHSVTAEEGSLLNKVIMKPELKVRCFQVQKIRYAWDGPGKQFRKVGVLEDGHSCAEMHSRFGSGLTSKEQDIRRAICGPNTINVEIRPVWKLLVKEVLSPFYIFQVFSVCLWLAENYVEYSVAIILMSLTSISLAVYDLRKQSVKLHHLVESQNNVLVKICRKQAGFQELESRHLVPGDTLVLEGGKTVLPCDALLISGQCVVNEGMLTGESIPVVKNCLPQDGGDTQPWHRSCAEDPKRHLLFCGTEIIQAKGDSEGPAKAVVLQTGFNTAKGALVRSILYPKPMNFRLYRDAIRFLMCLVGIAALGMVYAVCVFVLKGGKPGEVVKKTLDVITIAVPPALPAALTTGIIYTQRRLKRRGIFCISPQRINVCGQLNLICFDKTGTLTEDGLDLKGIVLVKGKSFQALHSFSSGHPLPWGPAFGAMVSCHSLLLLEGKTQGDPLDLKMFEATHWEIEDSEGKGGEWADVTVVKPGPQAEPGAGRGMAILQQFPFSSALQRMSVVARELGRGRHVFLKGAPEKVADLCRPETVPSSFTQELQLHTSQGFRVIGLAHKTLQAGMQVAPLTREEAESGLTFLGLLIMENPLKPETRPILEELSTARIRSVMVTGDNVQTAVTVARSAGLIPPASRVILVEAGARAGPPSACVTWSLLEECQETSVNMEGGSQNGAGRGQYHFCMSGSSYEVITRSFSHLLPKLLLNGTVFARMSPAQKASLVQELQKLDYFVGMCGDGANDCGALKVAHAGISLSEQEASMAAPFTSKVPNISCVPEVIRQGRAALVTSFCMFKYMAVYSVLQYTGVLLLYWQLNSFGNYQFLFQDLAINTLIGMTMSLNGASRKLVPYRPPAHLTSPPLLLSVVLNLVFGLAVQVCGFILVQKQPWYNPDSILSACTLGNASHAVELLEPAGSTLGAGGARNGSAGEEVAKSFRSYENTSVWLLCTISCLMVALVFSKGRPFRQPVYKNYVFVLVLLAQLGTCLFLLFANIEGLYAWMDLVCTPASWRITLLAMLSVTFAISFAVEEAVIENRALWSLLQKGLGHQPTSRYKLLRTALEKDPTWPPLNQTDFSGPVQIWARGSREVYSNPAFEDHEKQTGGLED
ncbi:probable cation-transporting ATPase 13A4 [Tiliqua scincoides]|uniref:probable cation-transporting ATPase 13A4 n=1 Tax=Tiliqua scincoides TaxID=71010 RepID=UPI003461FB79